MFGRDIEVGIGGWLLYGLKLTNGKGMLKENKMIYKVNIKDGDLLKDYIISVNKQDEVERNFEKNYDMKDGPNNAKVCWDTNSDPGLCYQIAYAEYEHCIRRMERLDNKIYILLTVCAFIFVVLINSISSIGEIMLPHNVIDWVLIVVYLLTTAITVILVIVLLIKLVNSLSTMETKRFDSFNVVERQMHIVDSKQVVGYVIPKMEQARFNNNNLVEERYRRVDACVKILILSIIMLILISIIDSVLPKVKGDYDVRLVDVVPIIHVTSEAKQTEGYEIK